MVQNIQVSYLVFMPKLSTHRMHDPGSIVPHIRPKVSILLVMHTMSAWFGHKNQA
jgi:hypothetical protein